MKGEENTNPDTEREMDEFLNTEGRNDARAAALEQEIQNMKAQGAAGWFESLPAEAQKKILSGDRPLNAATEQAVKRLSNARVDDVQEIAASQIELLTQFYDLSVSQARRSFRWALIASMVGFVFFLFAIGSLLFEQTNELATVSVIGGAMIEFIAGINFYLYGKTLAQLTLFHDRLGVTQRFLLANSLCESLGGDLKNQTRANLIGKLASIAINVDQTGIGNEPKKKPEEST